MCIRDRLYQVPEAVRAFMGAHALYLESMVKERMNEHRYLHSQSVAQLCVELAQAHGLDTRAAYIMGIAHDVCKQLPYEKAKAWMRAHMPDHLEEAAAIWHGYILSLIHIYAKQPIPNAAAYTLFPARIAALASVP